MMRLIVITSLALALSFHWHVTERLNRRHQADRQRAPILLLDKLESRGLRTMHATELISPKFIYSLFLLQICRRRMDLNISDQCTFASFLAPANVFRGA